MTLVHVLACNLLIHFENTLFLDLWISLVRSALNTWTWTLACFQKGLGWLFRKRTASSCQNLILYHVQ